MSAADTEIGQRQAECAIDGIKASHRTWERSNRRPRALSARDGLVALQFEAVVVWTAAWNLANGTPLTEEDLERLSLAYRRIDVIANEAAA